MKLKIGATLFLSLWLVTFAFGLTKMTSVALFNSTIDNTVIGGTTPATATFTSTHVTTSPTIPLPGQGLYQGWNRAGLGEGNFLNHPGTGVGGFGWYNGSGSSPTQLLSLSSAGLLSGTQTSFLNGLFNGNQTMALTGSLGLNLGYNQSGGGGESDFVNQQLGSGGGFNWYNTTSHTLGSPIMNLTGGGTLTVSQIIASLNGTVTGNLIGNASTATALAATPSQCGSGTQATGIQANGTPNCTPNKTLWTSTSSVCTTPNTGGNTQCTTNLTWPSPQFSGGTYLAVCQGYSPTGAYPLGLAVTGQTGSTITVQISNGVSAQGGAASFGTIVCEGNGS